MQFKITPAHAVTRLQFSTVRISAFSDDDCCSTGTGFFYHSGTREYLVTNKHVIEGCDHIEFPIHSATKDRPRPQYANLGQHSIYTTTRDQWIDHPNPDIDLCCIPVDDFISQPNKNNDTCFYICIPHVRLPDQEMLERLPVIMSVAMIGYPNGLWDEANGLPIIRQGSTASHPAIPFDGRDEVVLDMACFPGSSGSPIVMHDPKYFSSMPRFLGILYAGPQIDNQGQVLVSKIPTSTTQQVSVLTMMHLGYAIKSNVLQDFLIELEQ